MFFYRIYCRAFQAVMKLGNYFLGYRTPETMEGAGCSLALPEALRSRGAGKALIVTGPNIRRRGMLDPFLAAMDAAGLPYAVFSDLVPNPTSENVEAGLTVYLREGCESLVAFGGGGPMDCAKAIAARAVRPKRSVTQLQGVLTVRRRIPFFAAIPTTAGTGSETTVAAVITDAATHRKASIIDPAILPDLAVLDPDLTRSLPPAVTAETGLDALCHAVEAYTNRTYCTALENDLARRAVRLIYDNLLPAYRDGSDAAARQEMQRAAFYAGRAFTRGCVGYVHAVGHTLGGLYGVPHGRAMGILLPHVLRQYGAAAHRRLAELADVCGLGGGSDAEKAERFIAWIESVRCETGIPDRAEMIRDEDIPQIIRWAMREANPLYPVPAVWGEADFRRLLDTVRQ